MADSLFFDGTDDYINFSPGDILGTGALTMVAIIKKTGDVGDYKNIFGWNALDAGFFHDPSQNLMYYVGGSADLSAFTILAAEGWILVAFSKPAGSNAGRFHKYVYGTSTWTHSAGSAAAASFAACTVFRVGVNGDGGGSSFFAANYLIGGFWDSELSDATIETLELDQASWTTAAPDEAWRFDTMSAISSFAGGASAQTARTGTTLDVGDVPAGWTDSPPPAGPVVAWLRA